MPAHPARDLHRQGEPDLRPDPRRPRQRLERRPIADAVPREHHAELPPALAAVRHPGQLHGSGRWEHGWLVLEPAGPRDQHGDDHPADQLRVRQPGSVLRVRGDEPQRAGELRDRRGAGRRRRHRWNGELLGRDRQPARRHRQRADRDRQPRLQRRALRYPGRLHLLGGPAGRRHRPELRVFGEQHRQHRQPGGAGERSVRGGHRAGRAARSRARADDGRVLPRLRPELSGPVALQRVEARVRPVRRPGKPPQVPT